MKSNTTLLGILCGLATGLLMVAIGHALDRPVVEVVMATNGQEVCVRAYGPKGEMPCAIALRGTYEKVYVDPRAVTKKKNKNLDQTI